MEKQDFKHIVGEVTRGEPAIIRFFGEVNEYSANCFIREFLWLESNEPSQVSIHVNSSGGSVLHGMSVYSVIQNSKIPTECINEGLAASMGSIIWAAGQKSLMRDYAILMIHKPFSKIKGADEDVVKAFQHQISTIYTKRWGIAERDVKKIMDGEKDGTYFTAQEAVEKGIITRECVLTTSKQNVDKVKSAIKGIEDLEELESKISDVCNSIELDISGHKPFEKNPAISAGIPTTHVEKTKHKITMNENTIESNYTAIVALLGFSSSTKESDVIARTNALVLIEGKWKEAEQTINRLNIEKAGETAKLKTANDQLVEIKAELDKYKQAEKEAKDAEILSMINTAITDGKIEEKSKESWTAMASTNFELTKSTLDSIPKRDKITHEIAKDQKNIDDTKKGIATTEEQLQASIKEVLGEGFKLKTL